MLKRHRTGVLMMTLALTLLSGCGTADLARILFTSETAKEQVIDGVKSFIAPLTLASSPETGALPAPVLDAILGGGQSRAAVLMAVNQVGGPTWWILCAGKQVAECEAIPSSGHVRIAGTPLAGSAIIIPSRIGGD